MRRKDREVTDFDRITEILHSCDCCRVGFSDKNGVYIVPMNFGFTEYNRKITLYFHGAASGRKYELIKTNPHVGFEADTKHELVSGNAACEFSYKYQSIVGNGDISLVEAKGEKLNGLKIIMSHYTGICDWDIPQSALEKTAVFKLEVTELSCKEH